MTIQHVKDLKTPIGEVLEAAKSEAILLESEGQPRYAILPLDDELIDFLLERNPRFAEECRQIRDRIRAGEFRSHDDVKVLLGEQ